MQVFRGLDYKKSVVAGKGVIGFIRGVRSGLSLGRSSVLMGLKI